ncbi:hypothetical protein MPSI1_003350 [Malassezia psittaci]|uniref:AP-2 complex subunit alpha n=1 Tax=Malassezia psittaci TaxID=1821823 RepID=A0AAF0F9A8_9BASI|nr:hypothetical protein MPSI1_003350 [Malassezia psittaci]
MSQGGNMRGLSQYIAELRACTTDQAAERCVEKEMAHIKFKFSSGAKLDGYQRKKYVAKIVFSYLYGFPVDVGHSETIRLMNSTKYSEKQIGYLAMTILMPSQPNLLDLILPPIQKDLADRNETNTCLALHVLSTLQICAIAEALVEDVLKLLVSPTSSSWVQKKAALVLVHFHRLDPQVVTIGEWTDILASLLQSRHLGVAQSVANLLLAVCQRDTAAYRACYVPIIDKLDDLVLTEDYKEIYLYHAVPVPWLQVTLLRLLQTFAVPRNSSLILKLNTILDKILRIATTTSFSDMQHRNAYHAIQLEATRLALHLDTRSPVSIRAVTQLGNWLTASETNARYLALEVMAQLALKLPTLAPIQAHRSRILAALRDDDISVRRRALEVVYTLCDQLNVNEVVAYLLNYLPHTEPSLRSSIAMQVASLANRYTRTSSKYIDTMLALLRIPGVSSHESLRNQLINDVAQEECLHQYAALQALNLLTKESCNDALLQFAAYTLGEWGHTITSLPNAGASQQLRALQESARGSMPATRVMIMSTYLKWINLYPALRQPILAELQKYRSSVHLEVQQRACEYVALVQLNDPSVLESVCEIMPRTQVSTNPLPRIATNSANLQHNPSSQWVSYEAVPSSHPSLLHEDLLDMRDLDTKAPISRSSSPSLVHGEDWNSISLLRDDLQNEKQESESLLDISVPIVVRNSPNSVGSGSESESDFAEDKLNQHLSTAPSNRHHLRHYQIQSTRKQRIPSDSTESGSGEAIDHTKDLELRPSSAIAPLPISNPNGRLLPPITSSPLNWLGPEAGSSQAVTASKNLVNPIENKIDGPDSVLPPGSETLPNNTVGHASDSISSQEFRDSAKRITLHQDRFCRIVLSIDSWKLLFINLDHQAGQISVAKFEQCQGLQINFANVIAPHRFTPKQEMQVDLVVKCDACFTESPTLHIGIVWNDDKRLDLLLPLPITILHFLHPVAMQVGDFFQRWKALAGAQHEVKRVFARSKTVCAADTISTANLQVLQDVDRNRENVVGAGVFHSETTGPVACLVRYEVNHDVNLARCTVRTTDGTVSQTLADLLEARLCPENVAV